MATYAEHAVFEELNNTCQWVQLHDKFEGVVGNGRQWIYNGSGIHPQTNKERE